MICSHTFNPLWGWTWISCLSCNSKEIYLFKKKNTVFGVLMSILSCPACLINLKNDWCSAQLLQKLHGPMATLVGVRIGFASM